MLPPIALMMIGDEEDRQFLERLYLNYHTLMYGMALRVTRNQDLAQDAVSESLLSLIKKIDLLRSLECNKLRAYLVITVKHTAISLLNRGKRETAADDGAFLNLKSLFGTEEEALSRAGIGEIRQAALRLPQRERDVLLMRYFREMTDEEIAREMGIRPVSVRVQLSRARRHLAQLLGKEGE